MLLNKPPETCPNANVLDDKDEKLVSADGTAPEVDEEAEEVARTFFSGFELGTSDAAEIMRAKYGTVIAVLGQYDTGKTCFLASLYLMTACRGIGNELGFAGSLTLNGFEARARRLREWKDGALPKQLVDHTVLADPRKPAIVHLGLRERSSDRRRHDLLITDLPGEWSTDLIKDSGVADRFAFLKRTDGIVIALDGPMLNGSERHAAAHNARLLISRLADTLNVDRSLPFVLMVTKADEIGMEVPAIVASIQEHAIRAGFSSKVIPVAAISRTPAQIKSGTGVMDVIEYILGRNGILDAPKLAPAVVADGRHFSRIRG
ncbi:hypothetical protein RN69_04350 [Bradyrhizobium japonicum]|nr:hypothetical protein RN69_04350 [Bradyrhizobium japonicum]KMJ94182.1 hypothetical protein CF64_38545 [Bradyrhizobium japonicum]